MLNKKIEKKNSKKIIIYKGKKFIKTNKTTD